MIFLYESIFVLCLQEKGWYKHYLFNNLQSEYDCHVTVNYNTKNVCPLLFLLFNCF